MNIREAEECPSCVGHLIDDIPRLTQANVRPFVWSVLLYRSAVKPCEIAHAIQPLCSIEEIKEDTFSEKTLLELFVDEVLGEMTGEGLLVYNQANDAWTLTLGPNQINLPKIISVCCSLNASMPKHLLLEMDYQQRKRWAGS